MIITIRKKEKVRSIQDSLHVVLPLVIPPRPPVIHTTVNQILAVKRHL